MTSTTRWLAGAGASAVLLLGVAVPALAQDTDSATAGQATEQSSEASNSQVRPAESLAMDATPAERILVVDDEENITYLLLSALRHFGFDVAVASDGRSALKAVRAQPPDLVVLDVMLPDVDGFEVCRGTRADGIDTPVLFLTARDRRRAGCPGPSTSSTTSGPTAGRGTGTDGCTSSTCVADVDARLTVDRTLVHATIAFGVDRDAVDLIWAQTAGTIHRPVGRRIHIIAELALSPRTRVFGR